MNPTEPRIPVILDTDIGDDIDDTWALVMMLNSPELDIRLVCSDSGDTVYRARIIARLLEVAGRTDIPVGVGLQGASSAAGGQAEWVEDYDLAAYPGTVYEDGVGALIDTIMQSPEPVTLVCIGPVPNIAEALRREPAIASNARFVGMHGSVHKGYGGAAEVSAEWNVRADPASCRAAFEAPWDVTITPVDTCGLIVLDGERYKRVRDCRTPLAQALMDNYRIWAAQHGAGAEERSSTLFDTVAVYLAFSEELLNMERVGLRVTDDGYTRVDEAGKPVSCAISWRDQEAFEEFLVQRMTVDQGR
jgi:inosine-uridine nucleoside N-ribohydrolase